MEHLDQLVLVLVHADLVQRGRGVDLLSPVWHRLDLTPPSWATDTPRCTTSPAPGKGGLVAPVKTAEGRVAYWIATEDGLPKEGEAAGSDAKGGTTT